NAVGIENIMRGRPQNTHVREMRAVLRKETKSEEADQSLPIQFAPRRGRGYGRRVGAQGGPASVAAVIGVQGGEAVCPDVPLSRARVPGKDEKMAVESVRSFAPGGEVRNKRGQVLRRRLGAFAVVEDFSDRPGAPRFLGGLMQFHAGNQSLRPETDER